ncbi:MAG TPA: SGNH/GDSL hydrolase family protein [Planctomycetota bacterium]|nr:SGNH/GDSL hydrolase family protein [Planctomycetota bacterium]
MKIGRAALLVVAVLMTACLWLTELVFSQGIHLRFWRFYAFRLALLGMSGITLFLGLMWCVVRSRLSMSWKRCWSATYAILLALLLLEGAFMFLPASHNVGYTLGAKVWSQWYWKPVNSLGFRDPEHVAIPGKKLVFVVGDSFTAGAGIKRIEDRFSDLLGQQRPDLQVMNLGQCGGDSETEFRCLTKHPLSPDLLVLQYYVNDIEGTAARAGRRMPSFSPHQDLPALLRPVVRNSFLLDFLYWRFGHGDEQAYVEYLQAAMADKEVLQRHLQELEKFCAYATERGIPLVVVVFPCLQDLALGRSLTAPVERMFTAHDVPIVDVATLVESMDPADRTANHQDAHPSPRVHRLVADALAKVVDAVFDQRSHHR